MFTATLIQRTCVCVCVWGPQRAEVPVLQVYEVLSLILQVCEALLYLQSRGLVLRSLSSHSVLIVQPGVSKLTGLGFMVPR